MKWEFAAGRTVQAEGFNNAAINHFTSDRTGSLIREIVQNSLDAAVGNSVRLKFGLFDVPIGKAPELAALDKEFDRILGSDSLSDQSEKFLKRAKATIQSGKVRFLAIHDFGTTGLTGPLDGPKGAWFTLVRSTGRSEKSKEGALGSFGHGSKAPFAISGLRTVFYYSVVPGADEATSQKRLLGKTILQSSHDGDGRVTAATGFFGLGPNRSALIDGEIPKWVIETREDAGFGTTVLVADPRADSNFFELTRSALLANFFLAIQSGKLEVELGDFGLITKTSLEEHLENSLKWLSEDGKEYSEGLREKFRSIETIRNATHTGTIAIDSLDEIQYFFRLADSVTVKRVGIARSRGMLITHRAPQLINFPSHSFFDLVVWAKGPLASEMLVRLENPQHDQLSFDNVEDQEERKNLKAQYQLFASEIRKLVGSIAQNNSSEKIEISELQSLLSDPNSNADAEVISDRPTVRRVDPKYKQKVKLLGGDKSGRGRGSTGGEGTRQTAGGNIPSTSGEKFSSSGWSDSEPLESFRYVINGFDLSKKSASLTVKFRPAESGSFQLVLLRAGEASERQILSPLGHDNSPGVPISIKAEQDFVLAVEVFLGQEFDLDFGLEAILLESSSVEVAS